MRSPPFMSMSVHPVNSMRSKSCQQLLAMRSPPCARHHAFENIRLPFNHPQASTMRSKIFKLATIQSPRECHHPVPCNHSQASTVRPPPSKLATNKSTRDRQHHVLTIVRVPCVNHRSSTQRTSCAQNHASSCSPCAESMRRKDDKTVV